MAAYNYSASNARGIHDSYKEISAYFHSVIKHSYKKSFEEWMSEKEGWHGSGSKDDSELQIMYAWLEKRRWNAYLRSCGFVHKKNYGEKDFNLRLHPCLVETENPVSKDAKNGLKGYSLKSKYSNDNMYKDRLDDYSEVKNCDYKKYDLPKDAQKNENNILFF